jgi:excinuclease UvrABC nuclease subunit
LNLPGPPNRIECYDVSHTQGVATVGAMVVFTQGVPDKKLYRRFNINSTSIGVPDDFASMEEMRRGASAAGVLHRRPQTSPGQSRMPRSLSCRTWSSLTGARGSWGGP